MKVIDLFAGAGGFSTGATMAGANVIWAGNHWKEAVEVHSLNHPNTPHVCQDMHQANWELVPTHDVLLASPCCQGHSKAKGKPRMTGQSSRSTAWAVVSACEFHRPKFFVVENVPEFMTWVLFPSWMDAMKRLGYKVTINNLKSDEFGVDQVRPRLYFVGSLKKELIIKSPKLKARPFTELVDWDAPNWQSATHTFRGKPLCDATLEQIRVGRKRFGKRFLIAYYGNEAGGRDINKPIGTITTRDTFAIIDDDRRRFISVDEARQAMGFPDDYKLPKAHKLGLHLLGNSVCPPVAKSIIEQIGRVA